MSIINSFEEIVLNLTLWSVSPVLWPMVCYKLSTSDCKKHALQMVPLWRILKAKDKNLWSLAINYHYD